VGIIIRSRVRWHEHGEKNSKYFLNLDVSGKISANPFEIMDAQNRFHGKLYSKQTINLDGEDTKIFFENSNILRLSDELSASCEGKISLQECENILSSFQTSKTPGNEGLPIEFYKAFRPFIGKLMTDSFNEAFDKKEMSSSQKQAIVTLTEKKGKDRNYIGDLYH